MVAVVICVHQLKLSVQGLGVWLHGEHSKRTNVISRLSVVYESASGDISFFCAEERNVSEVLQLKRWVFSFQLFWKNNLCGKCCRKKC